MRKRVRSVNGRRYVTLGVAALASVLVMPGATQGADRVVLCEEFTATW